jgi:hypothetical protein
MRKFIIKYLIFISPLVLLFAWWERGLTRIPNPYNEKIRLLERAAPNCEVLVLGSSHAYLSINPSCFTQRGFNMANGSQVFYYDAEIIARYLPHLPKLKYVVFPVSYFSFEAHMLARTKESFRCPFYYRFYRLPAERWIDNFDIKNFSLIALYGLTDSVRYLKLGFHGNPVEHLADNGWLETPFDKSHENKNISDERGKRRADYHTAGMSEANIPYNRNELLRAITLCKNANVVPVLITIPVYHTYRDHMDRNKYERMQENVHSVGIETGTKYFNYLDDQRFDIDDFSDNDHLNAPGAEKFSKIVDQEVLQHLKKDAYQNEMHP